VTEHDQRLMCATCLAASENAPATGGHFLATLVRLAQGVVGPMIIWFAFILLGQTLLEAPSKFHEGTVWQQNWMD
jgi:hypothetical protein